MIPSRYQDFYGDETRWFVGTVISVKDPIELGRIKVRIMGVHGSEILDENLPFAQTVLPVTEGGTNGLGGGAGGGSGPRAANPGGSGVVMVRYKFQ